jgi:ectoine hydroxylase-related dioxygenase (phytanoyl-CoA dioxygenase family)
MSFDGTFHEEVDQIPWGERYDSPRQQVGAIFGRVARDHGRPGTEGYAVTPSTDYPELPQPSSDMAVLTRDFLKWGYCLVKDALDEQEVAEATERLVDQAAAERAAKVAQMGSRKNNSHDWGGSRQLVSNLPSKGDIWRKVATYETHNGALVEDLIQNILGKGFLISSMHGVLVEEGAGGQSMHQDQSFPLPHPPFPVHANVIYMYTPWSLENGGTYVIPGSATDGSGNSILTEDTDADEFVRNHKYGIVALCGPPGTCFVSDGRLLHAGAPRLAPGVRLGNNIYHCRAQMKQQENPWVSFCAMDQASPKLKRLLFGSESAEIGFGQIHLRAGGVVPVGELSMSRPEEFDQDFDFYYTEQARTYANETEGETATYNGPTRPDIMQQPEQQASKL